MTIAWKDIFDVFGTKRVTKTDKSKSAYLPNKGQRAAIKAAGIIPGATRPAPEFDVVILFDPDVRVIKASYYHSKRSAKAKKRAPEPRMGHGIISDWLSQGDQILIGNVGSQLFAFKLPSAPAAGDDITVEVASRASTQTVLDRAKRAKGKPARKSVTRNDFVRNPYVVVAALHRSGGKCEMPDCGRSLFFRDNGAPYLEVHHIVPLAENGDDTLANAAAMCPHCHRELHLGKNRKLLRKSLKAYIATLP
ncbi:HNH endonuclease [Rhodanobacter soli]|uniref:HNH endonuclease n=1 Tax=Rhodanobacter soli TaxID=590609 RepID=UPI0031E06974